MNGIREEIDSLLAEKPGFESDLEALLEIDDDGAWTFDEIPLDSGTFGEVVSRGLAEEVDGGYRLADPDAVRAVLDGEPVAPASDNTVDSSVFSFPDTDWRASLTLAGALAFVAITRVVFMWNNVFRGEHIVLAGNDPWGYRYYVEQLLAADLSLVAFGSLSELLDTGIAQDQLYVIVAWWTAELLGGTPHAAGLALAWLPVVSAVLTALVVYLLSVRLTADRRIGLASVTLLALTPAHAYRTALGFGDHHAFDYFWLVLTAYALVVLATENETADATRRSGVSTPKSWTSWAGVVLLGIGITAQSLAWRAGPLLYLPIAGYAIYRAVSDVRAGTSPLFGNLFFIAGIGVAAALTTLPSTVWGWPVSWIRSFAPALLLCGVIGVLLIGELGHRLDLPARVIGGGTLATGVAGIAIAWAVLPELTTTLTGFFDYLQRTGQSDIGETTSLFSGELGSVVGPILILGFVLYLAFPYVGMALRKASLNHRPAWAVTSIYTVYFLLLAMVQIRFAGQLAVFISVFAGIGFVHLAAVVDLTTRPRVLDNWCPALERDSLPTIGLPNRAVIGNLFVLFLLVTSISLVQVPIKQDQLATNDETYQTATWIESHFSGQDASSSAEYVFSDWSRNRVYNYLLNGDSQSYRFAQENYATFLGSENATEWYQRLRDRDAVIVTNPVYTQNPNSLQNRIHNLHGSQSTDSDGLAHYRTIHTSSDQAVTVPVPGATIVGTADPNGQIQISTDVDIDNTTIEYERQVEVNPYGVYSVTVPYPGDYSIAQNVTSVSEQDVMEGNRYVSHDRPGTAHWPFDAGNGTTAYDRVGGFTGNIEGATWTDGMNGNALSFDGEDDQVIVDSSGGGIQPVGPDSSLTISFWLRGSLDSSSAQYPTVLNLKNKNSGTTLGVWARAGETSDSGINDFGIRINGENGTTAKNFGIETTNFSDWTHVTAVLDREAVELRLYRNGSLVKSVDTPSLGALDSTERLTVGSGNGRDYAPVSVDNVRIFDQALGEESIEQLQG